MKEKVFNLEGRLTEEHSFEFIYKETDLERVVLDFSGLLTIDSSCLRKWILSLDSSKTQVIYRNCPTFLVSQFVMLSDLVKENVLVESFWMPFVCWESDTEESVFVETAKMIPDTKSFDPHSIEAPICKITNTKMEPDFEEVESYMWVERMGVFH